MSNLPGYELEDFVAWCLDLRVDGDGYANPSLAIAEALGNIPKRKNVTQSELADIVVLFEPYREMVEYRLSDFSEETQSWRDYAGSAFEFIPDEVYDRAAKIVEKT